MTILSSIFLGLIQGITEFLPVSSSAHLVIGQKLIPGFSQPGLLFDVLLHLGTTAAVVVYFRKRIFSMKFGEWFLLGVATIPAVLIGLAFKNILEAFFQSLFGVGLGLLVTGVLNLVVSREKSGSHKISIVDSLIIGFAQAIAIIPSISRSGATIFAATSLGISKRKAAEFSFLMSIPAILGANVLEIYSNRNQLELLSFSYIAGAITAAVVAFLSIGFLLRLVTSNKYVWFSVYCFILGIFTILISV